MVEKFEFKWQKKVVMDPAILSRLVEQKPNHMLEVEIGNEVLTNANRARVALQPEDPPQEGLSLKAK